MVSRHGTRENWAVLSHHGLVLVVIATDPDTRFAHVAECVGLTARTVRSIVDDLEAAGILTHTSDAGKNAYTVNAALAPELRAFLRPA